LKSRRALVAASAAVAAITMILGAIALYGPWKEEGQTIQAATGGGEVAGQAKDQGLPAPRVAGSTDRSPVVPSPRPEIRRAKLIIESPKDGAMVNMREDLTGRLESEGWPVIFIQAMIPGQPWWCQAPVTKDEGGRFTAKVVFGDEFTPSGTKYRIAAVVAPTREEAQRFAIGATGQTLPENLPQSAEVVVTHR